MDLSPVVAWSFPLLGVLIAANYGIRKARRGGTSIWAAAVGLSLALGFVLMFAQVAAHSACVESLKLCTSRGDANMSYWFQSLFCAPLYCLAAGCAWKVKQ